ncbi:sensor histidine kinase [Mucilaginibacter auburnensis]|uniref:histidine kinase n=1 Tax=Mucilaginibacter auburnensis TaxID=1457233 RepID=A0A2H9VUR1_9SPHI|nr:HAMP domain-containing sensor histidine kinase [Mucilaginibacter auburnensis]PJJ84556.1 signal transduction histidine kinase [Mucilaginibacter auburnensis]
MDTHYFRSLPGRYRAAFRNYYTLQNLVSIRYSSIVFLLINIILRVLIWVLPVSLTKAQNFPEFNVTNWLYIFVTPFFWGINELLLTNIKKTKKANAGMLVFVFLFAFYLILCGMYSAFIATSDPRNALTIYLIALSVVSVICVFEYDEVIALLVLSEIVFTGLLFMARTDATTMLYDQLMSIILLSGFYLISRYFYSYKASYYLQIIEIRNKNMEIEKAAEFKNQVLGMVAHDLRNPIAAVESLAMMMELDEDLSEDTQDSVGMIKASCIKARSIISDLLEAARNENLTNLELRKTEMNQWLNGIINTWKIQNDHKNNIVLLSGANPIYADINNEKFQRVLDNLISNAMKFSKERDNIELHLEQKGNKVSIKVKDRGLGIPANLLPHIFDRFSKAGRTGLNGEQSTGLGLSIVKQIVESHNGAISVESEEGKGTTFSIELPVT